MRQILAVCTAFFMAAAGTIAVQGQSAAQKTVWDGVYSAEQASRGATTYAATCANCHGANLEGANGKPLSGDAFMRDFQQRTVEYLFTFIRKNMPNNAARGTLDATTALDLSAFILSKNDFPAGTSPLTEENGAGVQIIPKGGAKELPASTGARVIGCLTKAGSGWTVTNGTVPERFDPAASGVTPADATRALGDRSYPLLFVITRLDRLAGHRVLVKGLLAGEGGSEGINVTEVANVADTCP